MNQKEKNNLLWLGTIVNTHGIKGEVRVLTDSDNKEERFAQGNTLYFYRKDDLEEIKIKSSRPHKQFILLTFEGIDNINDIEWIKGTKVYCSKDELDEDEYYLSDLNGLEVIDQTNEIIGKVINVVDQGPYNSLQVELKNGKSTNIPMVDAFEVEYNKEENKVFVNIPKEFLE